MIIMSIKLSRLLLLCVFIHISTCNITYSKISHQSPRHLDVPTSSTAASWKHKRALQKSHEKPQAEKWMEAFFGRNVAFDMVSSLVNLIVVITQEFLSGCTTVILYDSMVEEGDGLLLEQLCRRYPIPFVHGQITSDYKIKKPKMLKSTGNVCISYILFMADVMKAKDVIGEQSENKVVIVSRSSQWRVFEFLASELSRVFVNLLVVQKSEKILDEGIESAYILYTHKMYIDGIGSSEPVVLNSWKSNNFTRWTNLFPMKMTEGFAGHRFIVGVAHQPPFIVKKVSGGGDIVEWDGIELRLLDLLSEQYNFTTDIRESKNYDLLGSGNAVTDEVKSKRANLGIGGVYVTPEKFDIVDLSQAHSQDCAAFITVTSIALPRYRAIFGPFHWTVWLCVTCIYLFAIFPLVLSDKLTLTPLLRNPQEIENMFWYVFGTFTNCFTFKGPAAWAHSNKITTRVLIGFYWMFTIITTACYTGSIIAFVTLPIIPQTVDSTAELVRGRYRVGTLDRGGWEYWFANSTDSHTDKLFKSIEYLPNVQAGLKNVTSAFFWSYAFLGSRDELDFIVRTNFTTQSKRNVLHISNNCFAPYGVAMLFPRNAIYKNTFNRGILNAVQSGFIRKVKTDMEFELMRSPTGKLLSANVGGKLNFIIEDRALSLDDTQGMFILLGIGFLLGSFSLISEWLGGCVNFCKQRMRRHSTTSIQSNHRSHDIPTPRDKVGSLQYSIHTRMHSFSDAPSEVDENHVGENGIAPEIYQHHVIQKSIEEFNGNRINLNKEMLPNGIQGNTDEVGDNYDEEIDKAFDLDDMLFGELKTDDDDDGEEELHFTEGELTFIP